MQSNNGCVRVLLAAENSKIFRGFQKEVTILWSSKNKQLLVMGMEVEGRREEREEDCGKPYT